MIACNQKKIVRYANIQVKVKWWASWVPDGKKYLHSSTVATLMKTDHKQMWNQNALYEDINKIFKVSKKSDAALRSLTTLKYTLAWWYKGVPLNNFQVWPSKLKAATPTRMSRQAAFRSVIWSAMVSPVNPGTRLANSTILIMHLVASSLNLSHRPRSSLTRWSALEFCNTQTEKKGVRQKRQRLYVTAHDCC